VGPLSETCPNCGTETAALFAVETGLKLRLKEEAQMASIPNEVCESCMKEFNKTVSRGAKLRVEQHAKEQNRILLWRNRVNLVKQAKLLMMQKKFSEAAVSYEKYLRVLEIVYDKKSGELTPELFRNEARKHELTVITSVYWDLMRIYDTSSRYGDRQMRAAEKLASFARFTPVFPNIVRRAESHTRSAKNPQAFHKFLTLSNKERPRCFIATSAYEGQKTETVLALCTFRDEFLKTRSWGRSATAFYYRISPPIAEFLDRHPALKPATRWALEAIRRALPKD
jgi:hypothetical protein